MTGVEPWKTGLPELSRVDSVPSAAVRSVMPVVRAMSFSEASAGLRAASAVFTTSTSVNPLSPAVTRRSTPGSTSG